MKIIPRLRGRVLLWPFFGLTLLLVSAPELEAQSRSETLIAGQRVYQANCAVCHGVEGDGNGPTASMFRIRPRDFRPGIYKFRSTPAGSLPTDDDLLRTVTEGLRWTGMVGRPDLPENARNAVVQYLKTFSSRFKEEQPAKPVIVPPASAKTAQLVSQGQKLYRDLGCVACHGPMGQGNGLAAKGLKDEWNWPIWPSDLTWRPLKRGSDLKETYLTIATGLSGTPMLSYASALRGQQGWALVYYLESLVPPEHRLSRDQLLGEERRGWMVVRMGGMMGGGMMR